MKKYGHLYLVVILSAMVWSDISWGRTYGHTAHGARTYGSSGVHRHTRGHIGSRRNLSLGVGYRSGRAFRSYGHGYRGYRGSRSRIGFYGNFSYGWPSYYYRPYGYWNSYYWPAFSPVIYPPVVVVPTEPSVYIQQPQTSRVISSSTSANTEYWYYCENPAGYYPEVQNCSDDWIRVLPRSAQ